MNAVSAATGNLHESARADFVRDLSALADAGTPARKVSIEEIAALGIPVIEEPA